MNLNKKIKYYISGPMTGLPDFNYPAFNSMAKFLREKGFDVENPAENPVQETWGDYMTQAIKQMMDCGAIIMLQGWDNSRGAQIEFDLAVKLGFLVICESDLYTHNVIGRIAVESES